jgi:hypothetical protein
LPSHSPVPDEHACLSCGSTDVEVFHQEAGVPVNSCLLLASEAEARAFPRGAIRLGFCHACGFIANTAFDQALAEYSTRYEETQGFSPRFQRFADDLVHRLVDPFRPARQGHPRDRLRQGRVPAARLRAGQQPRRRGRPQRGTRPGARPGRRPGQPTWPVGRPPPSSSSCPTCSGCCARSPSGTSTTSTARTSRSARWCGCSNATASRCWTPASTTTTSTSCWRPVPTRAPGGSRSEAVAGWR